MSSFTENISPSKRWTGVILAVCLALAFANAPAWAKRDSSASSQKLYTQAQKEYQSLLYSKKKIKYRQNWERAIAKFQAVLKKYPKTHESYKAVFTLGRLHHKLGKRAGRPADLDKALSYYHRLETEFPAGQLTDDALYYSGELYLSRKHYREAHSAFQKIISQHPKGDFVPKARRQLQRKILKAKLPKSTPAPSVLLKALTFASRAGETRVVLEAEGIVRYTQKKLVNPDRIYFDFQNARWGKHIPANIPIEDGGIQQLRMTHTKGAPTRLVLDLEGNANRDVVVRKYRNRLIITVPHAKKFIAVKSKSNTVVAKVRQETPVVVLDAGHGGKDFGAKGAKGLYEKELNLRISKRVKKILEDRYRYKVIMTRKDDTFIELRDRGKIANKHSADLFVSIHANAAPRKSAKGIETYYLGSGSTEQARETAERENGVVHSVDDDTVQGILASLITTIKINDSARLAASVQKRLYKTMSKRFSGIQNLGVKEGPFFVLHDTNMPSILVEVGFVTNRKEGRQLKTRKYQRWLAESIARGIHDYLKEKAPSI